MVVSMTLLGCGNNPKQVIARRDSLKIMVINVWSGLDYKGTLKMGEYETPEVRQKRYKLLLDEISRRSPDIIGINEANFLPDYARRLARDTGYDIIYHVGVAGLHVFRMGIPWNLKEGDCVLAKKDLNLQWVGRKQLSGGGFIWNNLSFHTADATQVVVGRIRVNDENIYIAVTHWHASPPNNDAMRAEIKDLIKNFKYSASQEEQALKTLQSDQQWRMGEARDMAAFLKKVVPSGAKLIVLGDFNAEDDSPEIKAFAKEGYRDGFRRIGKGPGYTWDSDANTNIKKYYLSGKEKVFDSLYDHLNMINEGIPKRIDYVFFNDAFAASKVLESEVCCNRMVDGLHPSDHYGVYTVISLKP